MFGRMNAALSNGGSHRTGAPVRRNSRLRGNEGGFWRSITRKDAWRIVLAARRYEVANKERGQRNGPLGAVGLEVLELLANMVDYRSGRLEPSIDTIMTRLRRSRDAIVRALKALRAHGFVDWLRRYIPTQNDGSGPQVQQTSNAYRLAMPARAQATLDRYSDAPTPDDRAQADLERLKEEARHEVSKYGIEALQALAETPTFAGRRAKMMLQLLQERESAEQTEPAARYLL